jgi:hypothetical protein
MFIFLHFTNHLLSFLNTHLFFRSFVELLNQRICHLFVGGLRLFCYDLINSNRKVFQTLGIFCFFDFFTFWGWVRRFIYPWLLFLYWSLLLFAFLFLTEQTCIFLEFKSSSNRLNMVLRIFSAVVVLTVKLKIVCVLTGRVERKKEHWCFRRAIKWGMEMLDRRRNEIGLVCGLIVYLLVLMKVMVKQTFSFA